MEKEGKTHKKARKIGKQKKQGNRKKQGLEGQGLEKFRKNSGKSPKRSESVSWNFPRRVRLGSPKPYTSRHLRLPEHFQKSLPPSTAGDASFFRSGSGEGLSEPVMEFPAVLEAFLTISLPPFHLKIFAPPPFTSTLPHFNLFVASVLALAASIHHPNRNGYTLAGDEFRKHSLCN